MSQNGTTPTTDENRAPANIHAPLFLPMMPMFFPYGNANTAGQQFYTPAVYSNISPYPSANNRRQPNFGIGYNPFYAPFYSPLNNILSPATHITNSSTLMSPHPLMGPPASLLSLPQQPSSGPLSVVPNDTERNKNLNIRECQSPIIIVPKKEKKPLQIVHPNDNNTELRIRTDSSSTSSLVSHSESDPPIPRSSSIQEIDSDNPQDDFLTFIEQKSKTTKITMPELNPFANEFSFINNKTLTNDTSVTRNGIENNNSSYRLLFDNLIEKSLESIEAIKKSAKKVSVNDISVQCDRINDSINRSTQTVDQKTNSDLVEEYSLRTIKLMDKLLENFRNIYQNDLHKEFQTMAHTCDELRHLILFIHHTISSSDNEQRKKSSNDLDNPFSEMIKELLNDMTNRKKYQTSSSSSSSSQITLAVGRGTRRLMSSTCNSPVPSFSCRQIDPVITIKSKLCLLCQRPLDDTDDAMHKLCRSISSRPNTSTDT